MSELLQNHNFKFQKKYGQNFLQDVKIPRRIAMECTDNVFPEGDTIPEEKADQNPHALEKIGNAVGRGICFVMDDVIFKTKELESEKWLKEHPEFK